MYLKRFGLSRRPFPPAPDPNFYYPATAPETALATLRRGLDQDEGLLLLTGTPGTGKTLLGYTLLDRLDGDLVSAFLVNGRLPDRTALLQAILYDLGLSYHGGGEQVLRLRLTDFLLKNCAAGRRALLVIDEAHHLSADLLEELRLLANLEAGGVRAVQVLLLAQPSITETLKQPSLAALQQRLVVRAGIDPFGAEEACDYLNTRLRLAGGDPIKIIEEPALEILARGSGGVPRLLNQAAHQALLLADAAELPRVDAEAALEGLALLGLGPTEVEDDIDLPTSENAVLGSIGHLDEVSEAEDKAPPLRVMNKARRSA